VRLIKAGAGKLYHPPEAGPSERNDGILTK